MTQDVVKGEKSAISIPERRPPKELRDRMREEQKQGTGAEGVPAIARAPGQGIRISLSYPVWRCKVCGYLCARDEPPDICPICKVTKDRFELFI